MHNHIEPLIHSTMLDSHVHGQCCTLLQVAALTDLPIWIAETGTTSYGTDKPQWLRQMFVDITKRYTRVRQVGASAPLSCIILSVATGFHANTGATSYAASFSAVSVRKSMNSSCAQGGGCLTLVSGNIDCAE
jgi:hypothetical protein